MFAIEDEAHDERLGSFDRCEDALAELHRLASLPWDAEPNRAPCTNWRNCGRRYELVEYDARQAPWRERSRRLMLEVVHGGTTWAGTPDAA